MFLKCFRMKSQLSMTESKLQRLTSMAHQRALCKAISTSRSDDLTKQSKAETLWWPASISFVFFLAGGADRQQHLWIHPSSWSWRNGCLAHLPSHVLPASFDTLLSTRYDQKQAHCFHTSLAPTRADYKLSFILSLRQKVYDNSCKYFFASNRI